jgi:hypothetical protein
VRQLAVVSEFNDSDERIIASPWMEPSDENWFPGVCDESVIDGTLVIVPLPWRAGKNTFYNSCSLRCTHQTAQDNYSEN